MESEPCIPECPTWHEGREREREKDGQCVESWVICDAWNELKKDGPTRYRGAQTQYTGKGAACTYLRTCMFVRLILDNELFWFEHAQFSEDGSVDGPSYSSSSSSGDRSFRGASLLCNSCTVQRTRFIFHGLCLWVCGSVFWFCVCRTVHTCVSVCGSICWVTTRIVVVSITSVLDWIQWTSERSV